MKFTLTYDGELRSNAGVKQKWEIRKQFHPQLAELWQIDRSLQKVWAERNWPQGGVLYTEMHHSEEIPQQDLLSDHKYIDLCAPIEKGGRKFIPIVRESFLLNCGLKILFLRKEPPGRVYQGGDMDNRLKTLFDSLAVPAHAEHVLPDQDAPDPMYTLLEDDAAITRVEIETHRLLSRPGGNAHDVRLIIEVDVRVAQPRYYNQAFLGG
ncbi:MAG: hypothetical protein LCH88_16780 [Proteobacteria bacterium]|nr:hypothetical protein [Pseudomonadota bacterium]MCA0319716.1 hypothetical protein [Pseudomonadota bacterium]